MASKNITITFSFERETKNTIRYSEDMAAEDERPIVGTLYVLKSALDADPPKKLTVTIKSA
jgi:hypothetical protein